ncbi:Histone acetyltransferase [Pleurostoma richardsiae]|uniref:histone acetyltransferase n=1 Tax=Pleurostoma richardsiae TaxID=41990 RepID=A0AA38RK57_9PEZI|nr:Histone acetyltransferase [Pleurostoma richardsiae]
MASPVSHSDKPTRQVSNSTTLSDTLAAVLPAGYKFGIFHLSTPPTRSDPLCSAPPGAHPDRTYCESHFLAVTIDPTHNTRAFQSKASSTTSDIQHGDYASSPSSTQVLVLAIEIFIFTTACSSTFFVSKADSTGYLHLLGLPNGTPSPIREISSAFISYLVALRRRSDAQSVVSLFARAQDQYLFPGSIEYAGKHVLDDRALVRWWCRVLDPLIASNQGPTGAAANPTRETSWESVEGYLLVPGLDAHESRAFIPRTPHASKSWTVGHPLEKVSHFSREYDWVPPRCLIPRFPDDPKSRFRDELDLEAAQWAEHKEKGSWRSIKTVDQFWDMMAFRQECSGGHMTGFIWVVMNPPSLQNRQPVMLALLTPEASFNGSEPPGAPSTPPRRRDGLVATTSQSSPFKDAKSPGEPHQHTQTSRQMERSKKRKLKGHIRPRLPRIKRHARNYDPDIPQTTPYYYWPPEGRGTRVLAEPDYKRSIELLLRLDFANVDLAVASTSRWTSEVGGGIKWAVEVIGTRSLPSPAPFKGGASGTTLNSQDGLVRKKRPAEALAESKAPVGVGRINALPAGLVRKKQKMDKIEVESNKSRADPSMDILSEGLIREKCGDDKGRAQASVGEATTMVDESKGADQQEASAGAGLPKVNLLGSELVRKKPKASRGAQRRL